MSAFVLVNVPQVRLEEIGAVATVERAMGVKRALNAHQQPGEGVDISQMSTSGWKYVHKVQLQQISIHTGPYCTSFCSDKYSLHWIFWKGIKHT